MTVLVGWGSLVLILGLVLTAAFGLSWLVPGIPPWITISVSTVLLIGVAWAICVWWMETYL